MPSRPMTLEERLVRREANRRSRYKMRQLARARGEAETYKVGHHVFKHSRVSEEEFTAKLAEIPPDRRDITGLMMGDPIPGDHRRQIYVGEGYRSGR